ncbi:phosphatase PAP2 family protein [Mucilaginibacter ginkgonis]|uniref:Phosphatase PAP2 family protein n=1 Tax=Mucilaginibacter ginkgonis TaxID=2682091 RepID=A0A6I4I061_9SPHI|nr:phosphatase PAP2 family protein [Mucilaginibacter ginkgonis]QQL48901.1 phosphatase PAP2 family protein [Mucilaginibacter ginkgonis]
MKRQRLALFTAILFFCLQNVYAQVDTAKKNIADTIKKDLTTAPDTVKHLHSKGWTFIPPAVMLAYGASSFAIEPLRRLDRSIYQQANDHNFVVRSHIEDYFQYAPVVLTYGLNLVGIHGKNTFLDRTLLFVLSEGIASGTAFIVKHASHRLRPNNADYYSFPSGHTTNAFAEAEFMSQELGAKSWVYSAVGYGFATTTGIFRIYHQDHWFSDVVAGAGLGILSTKAAYLIYPYLRNHLTKAGREKERNKDLPNELKKQPKTSSILVPSYRDGNLGLSFSMQL